MTPPKPTFINERWPLEAVRALQQVEREMPSATYREKARRLFELYPDPRNGPKAVKNKIEKLRVASLRTGQDWRTLDLDSLAPTTDPRRGLTLTDRTSPQGLREIEAKGRITTLDQLLEAARVDLTRWKVKDFKVNAWETGAVGPDGDVVVTDLWQVKATLVPANEILELEALKEAILEDIRREAARIPTPECVPLPSLEDADDRYLLEISPADLHVGKLSWHEETGENYDAAVASSLFRYALEDVLRKASPFPLEKIVVVVGNDLSHVDNALNETTGGTRQDADSRWLRNLRVARKLMSWAIRRCRAIAPVHVVIVPGNHDRHTAISVGEILAAEFAGDERVTVDNSPTLRKYFHFGVNLIGWTHGSEEKMQDLPLIMAREVPELWARAQVYEWHVGHLHKSKEVRFTAGDEFNGVRVRVLPSLCGTDAWHYQKGYVKSRRALEAYLWGRETGYAGHLSSTVLERPAA